MKIFLTAILVWVLLFSQKSYGQNTIEADIDNFLSEKQKELIYLFIKEDLTFYLSKKSTDTIYERVYRPDIIKTSANELFKSYHDNEISADDIYRNKKIILRGIIADINRGMGEQYFIRFALPNQFLSITAFFNTEYKEELAKLKRNQQYQVFCICDGMSMGSPILKHCKPINDWVEEETIKILNNSYFNLKSLTKIIDVFTSENQFLMVMFFIKVKTDIEVEKLVNLLKQGVKDDKHITEFMGVLCGKKELSIMNNINENIKIENINSFKSLDIFQKIELIKQEREKILLEDKK